MKRIIFMTLLVTALTLSASAQINYRLSQDDLQLTVEGTSSLHDWEMNVTGVNGHFTLDMSGESLEGISKLKVRVDANSIKNGNGIMDRKAARALETDQHPEISYVLDRVLSFSNTADSIKGKLSGSLTIAGVEKDVTIDFESQYSDNEILIIKGNTSVLMTDFGIDPPRALAGTLKTGDRVELIFNTKWIPEEITMNVSGNNN